MVTAKTFGWTPKQTDEVEIETLQTMLIALEETNKMETEAIRNSK